MLDLAGILFNSLMMLIVVVGAVRLDRSEPWFQTATKKASAEKVAPPLTGSPPWRRRG